MKLKNLIAGACALCGIVFSASAELPAGYTQVASVKTDGAQFVNLNYTWQANSSATNEITPSVTVDVDTNFSNFLSGVAADVCSLKIFEDETLVCDFVPGVENTSGDFGLYDRERETRRLGRADERHERHVHGRRADSAAQGSACGGTAAAQGACRAGRPHGEGASAGEDARLRAQAHRPSAQGGRDLRDRGGEPAAGRARNVGREMSGERSNLSAVWTYSV